MNHQPIVPTLNAQIRCNEDAKLLFNDLELELHCHVDRALLISN